MHTLLILYPPQENPATFKTYYEQTHLGLVRKIPGIRQFRYGFDLAALEGASPYFCMFEADFDSAEALGAAMGSPEGQATAADVANFASGQPVILNFSKSTG